MYRDRSGAITEDKTGERIATGDVLVAETMQAVLAALDVETVTLKRRIHDRHGRRPMALIEYTPTELAAKLADGYVTAYGGDGGAIEERR